MSINDNDAQRDWKWQCKYNLENMVEDIIINLKAKYKITA